MMMMTSSRAVYSLLFLVRKDTSCEYIIHISRNPQPFNSATCHKGLSNISKRHQYDCAFRIGHLLAGSLFKWMLCQQASQRRAPQQKFGRRWWRRRRQFLWCDHRRTVAARGLRTIRISLRRRTIVSGLPIHQHRWRDRRSGRGARVRGRFDLRRGQHGVLFAPISGGRLHGRNGHGRAATVQGIGERDGPGPIEGVKECVGDGIRMQRVWIV